MPVVNVINNLSRSFHKSFDKGKIDKLYDKMHAVVQSRAAQETLDFMNKMTLEYNK